MNKDTITIITEALGEIYSTMQSRLVQTATKQLGAIKGDSASDWKRKQLNALKTLKNKFLEDIESMTEIMNRSTKNAIKLLMEDSVEDLKVSEKELKKEIESFNKQMQKQNALEVNALIVASLLMHKQNVNKVYQSLPKTEKINFDDLYQGIEKVVNGIGVENAPKVPYYSKTDRKQVVRMVGWREHMEMNVRTTFSQKATDFQYQISKQNGIVLYLCNSFSNCADDHKNYQGKIYYDKTMVKSIKDEEQREKVKEYIRTHKVLEVNDVKDNDPWLTSRPNCRHKFLPLTIEEVLTTSVKKLLVDNKMINGKYEARNYQMLQQQRANERTIRRYKERRDNRLKSLANAETQEQKDAIQDLIDKDNQLIRKWQKANKKLVDSNPHLEREYRREDYKRLIKDLGVKYNSKK